MRKFIYILLLPASLIFLSLKIADDPKNTCKLGKKVNKKAGSITYKTKGADWAGFEKTIGQADSSIYMWLFIADSELDTINGIRLIFRDGTSLTMPDAPARHEMGSAASASVYHSSTFALKEDDIKRLKENLILEFRIGRSAQKMLSEKQSLKLQEGLNCILSAR
jgi:hypothetical protein